MSLKPLWIPESAHIIIIPEPNLSSVMLDADHSFRHTGERRYPENSLEFIHSMEWTSYRLWIPACAGMTEWGGLPLSAKNMPGQTPQG